MSDSIYMASIYRLTGVNFWQSAEVLSENLEVDEHGVPRKLTALPLYFLVSHAAELLLKAALLKRGFVEKKLRLYGYRHNLERLLDELLNKGVTVTPATSALVRSLSVQHKTHALRYSALVDNGQPTFMPPPPALFEMLKELLMLTRVSTQGT